MNESSFQRTNSGKAVKPRFVGRTICYVEGVEDVTFFSPIANMLGVKFEPAFGKPNAEELARALVSRGGRYVVVFDNDFDDVLGKRFVDERIVYLPVYSVENLPVVDATLDSILKSYCGLSDETDAGSAALEEFFARACDVFHLLVLYDLATRVRDKENTLVPRHADVIFANRPGLKVCDVWRSTVMAAVADMRDDLDEAESMLAGTAVFERLTRYLRGHVIFGLLRRLFISVVKLLSGAKPNVDNRAFLAMLGEAFWRERRAAADALIMNLQMAISRAA